jgi:hypothetical protein
MPSKTFIWIGMFVGSSIGSYLPVLWGAGFFSFTSIVLSAIGAIAGIWLGFKISKMING